MGNPHDVVFMDDIKNLEIEKIGPLFENHERFPNRINTEFVNVIDRHTAQNASMGKRLGRNTGMRNRCLCSCSCLHLKWTDRKYGDSKIVRRSGPSNRMGPRKKYCLHDRPGRSLI